MRFILSLAFVFVLLVAPAWAQTTKDLGNTIFKEVEKRAIEEFFGKKAAQAVTGDDDDKGQGRGQGQGKKNKKWKKKKDKSNGRGRGGGMPPGLAKRGSLPPGLQKQLERNGTLPPGLAKRDLPDDLKSKLPPVPEGLERVIADESVVLIEKATGKILDVIQGVLKKK